MHITYVWMYPLCTVEYLRMPHKGITCYHSLPNLKSSLVHYWYTPWNITCHSRTARLPALPQKETFQWLSSNYIHFQMLVADGSEIPNNQPPGMYKLKSMGEMGETSPNLNWLCSQIPKKTSIGVTKFRKTFLWWKIIPRAKPVAYS